jgi:ketosteroid isomerase-like protein
VGKAYGPVVWGETLSGIAKKLGYNQAEAMRVAVAIWMGNKEKFIGGNIHGLKSTESLYLGNMDNLLPQVSLSEAKKTIMAQLEAWKLRGHAEQKATASISPEMLSLLEGWRQSWEAGDLERHMAYFSNSSSADKPTPYAVWKEVKKRMFDRHTHVKIRVERPLAVQKKGQSSIMFDQSFRSDQMATYGRKSIDLIKDGDGWKIVNEGFVRVKREAKDREISSGTDSVPVNPEAEILQTLEDWRQSWEAGDLERHMALFSKRMILSGPDGKKSPFDAWNNIKKRMFEHHKNVEVHLGVPVLKRSGDRWTLSVEQTFHSDKMDAFGRKNIEFMREHAGWRIVKEEFVPVSPAAEKE